jgi:hypothetical protein
LIFIFAGTYLVCTSKWIVNMYILYNQLKIEIKIIFFILAIINALVNNVNFLIITNPWMSMTLNMFFSWVIILNHFLKLNKKVLTTSDCLFLFH